MISENGMASQVKTETVKETAKAKGVDVSTVREWCRTGKLTATEPQGKGKGWEIVVDEKYATVGRQRKPKRDTVLAWAQAVEGEKIPLREVIPALVGAPESPAKPGPTNEENQEYVEKVRLEQTQRRKPPVEPVEQKHVCVVCMSHLCMCGDTTLDCETCEDCGGCMAEQAAKEIAELKKNLGIEIKRAIDSEVQCSELHGKIEDMGKAEQEPGAIADELLAEPENPEESAEDRLLRKMEAFLNRLSGKGTRRSGEDDPDGVKGVVRLLFKQAAYDAWERDRANNELADALYDNEKLNEKLAVAQGEIERLAGEVENHEFLWREARKIAQGWSEKAQEWEKRSRLVSAAMTEEREAFQELAAKLQAEKTAAEECAGKALLERDNALAMVEEYRQKVQEQAMRMAGWKPPVVIDAQAEVVREQVIEEPADVPANASVEVVDTVLGRERGRNQYEQETDLAPQKTRRGSVSEVSGDDLFACADLEDPHVGLLPGEYIEELDGPIMGLEEQAELDERLDIPGILDEIFSEKQD